MFYNNNVAFSFKSVNHMMSEVLLIVSLMSSQTVAWPFIYLMSRESFFYFLLFLFVRNKSLNLLFNI